MEDWRIAELRTLGASIGQSVYFGPEVYIEKDFAQLLTIGDGAVLSQGTTILLHDSSLNNVIGAPIEFSRVVLGPRSYLGANSTVLCGVEVGASALVGACSLVTTDIPARMVAVGQPARVVATVDEVAERHARRAEGDPKWIGLTAAPWRDRSPADLVALNERVAAAIASLDS